MIEALIVLACLGAIALLLCFFAGSKADTTCNQNCNQGRSCTCVAAKSTNV